MLEYPWNEKNNTFKWLSSLYNPFKAQILHNLKLKELKSSGISGLIFGAETVQNSYIVYYVLRSPLSKNPFESFL